MNACSKRVEPGSGHGRPRLGIAHRGKAGAEGVGAANGNVLQSR